MVRKALIEIAKIKKIQERGNASSGAVQPNDKVKTQNGVGCHKGLPKEKPLNEKDSIAQVKN